jgi:hypothetical protein
MLRFSLKATAAQEVLAHLHNVLAELAAEIPQEAAASERTT